MEKPSISIIVPAYNCERYIMQLIKSIQSQNYKNFEVIIIDDGSTDHTAKICDLVAKKDARFKIFHIDNSGQSFARNIGVMKARGSYITFADSDDIVASDWLSTILADFLNFHADIVNVEYTLFSNKSHLNVKFAKKFEPYILNQEEAYNEWLVDRRLKGFLWNKAFKASLIKDSFEILNFNFLEDSFNVLKCLRQISSIYMEPQVLYFYRDHGDSVVNGQLKDSDLGCVSRIYIELDDVCNNLYPQLKQSVNLRMAKIELFLMSRMNFHQLRNNSKMLHDFEVKINDRNVDESLFFNTIELFLLRNKKSVFRLFVNFKIRNFLVLLKTRFSFFVMTIRALREHHL